MGNATTLFMAFHIFLLFSLALCTRTGARSGLSQNFYKSICPNLRSIVQAAVKAEIKKERRKGASIVHQFFHDSFVNGCDGSEILGYNAMGGYKVMAKIIAEVEKACSGEVSLSDIIALAAHDAVVSFGGPSWVVKLGRYDSLNKDTTLSDDLICHPKSNLSALEAGLSICGLTERDMISLFGVRTIGFAKCKQFRRRINNDSNIDPSFAKSLQKICPPNGNDNVLIPIDSTPYRFDNVYFKNLINKKGLLPWDQELLVSDSTRGLVQRYADDLNEFFHDFSIAMEKMVNLKSQCPTYKGGDTVKMGLVHSDRALLDVDSTSDDVETHDNDSETFFHDFSGSMGKMGNLKRPPGAS